MRTLHLPTAADFTAVSLADALELLGDPRPYKCTIILPQSQEQAFWDGMAGREARGGDIPEVVLVPDTIMTSPDAWAVINHEGGCQVVEQGTDN